MSGRIFQNVVLQLKENTDRTVGVIDGEGIVIACSELAMIGQRWAEHVPAINAAGGAIVTSEGKTFKALNGWGTQFDYAAFAFGDNEISKILTGDNEKEVQIYFGANHILFEFDDTIVVSRLIEGEYFKVDQMLSSDYATKISVNKKEFLDCIERASILIRENDKKPIILNIEESKMALKLNSSFGTMNAEILIHKTGQDLMIGFNPKFLIDALRIIDDENVTLYMMNPKSPCFIKDEEETYIYLILPVNFNAAAV